MRTIASAVLLAYLANGQGPPVEIVPPAPVDPIPPPQAPVDPLPAPVEPVIPAPAAPAPPQAGPPQNTAPPLPPPIVPLDPGSYQCNNFDCIGRTINVIPSQGWSFTCAGHCNGMTLNIEVGYDPANMGAMVTELGDIKFSGPSSGRGATINFVHNMGSQFAGTLRVEMKEFLCDGAGSCQGMTINAYPGIDMGTMNFECGGPLACMGCMWRDGVKVEGCDSNHNPQGGVLLPHLIGPAAPGLPGGNIPIVYVPGANPADPASLPVYTGRATPPAAAAPGPQQQPQQPVQPLPQPQYPQYYPQPPLPQYYPYPYPYPYPGP